jgi:hypothetical protein
MMNENRTLTTKDPSAPVVALGILATAVAFFANEIIIAVHLGLLVFNFFEMYRRGWLQAAVSSVLIVLVANAFLYSATLFMPHQSLRAVAEVAVLEDHKDEFEKKVEQFTKSFENGDVQIKKTDREHVNSSITASYLSFMFSRIGGSHPEFGSDPVGVKAAFKSHKMVALANPSAQDSFKSVFCMAGPDGKILYTNVGAELSSLNVFDNPTFAPITKVCEKALRLPDSPPRDEGKTDIKEE